MVDLVEVPANHAKEFVWDNSELKEFWESCFPQFYDSYTFDGLHPKALCSKICNDILRTNININSASPNPNDRMLCFEVLTNLETKLIDAGTIQQPTAKPGGTPSQLLYKRVSHSDWNKFAAVLGERTLEQWARTVVEETIRRLQQSRKRT